MALSELKALGDAVKTEFREKNVTFLAGSIAYNAFVSLLPLLLFFVFALAVLEAGWEDRFLALVTRNVSPTIGEFIARLFRQEASGAAGSSVVGLVILVWGSLKLFRGLDTAFAMIYEVDADRSIVDQFRDGVVVLLSVALAVAAIVAATGAFAVFSGTLPFLGVFLPLVLTIGLLVAFFPMYYVFPNADVSPVEILPGVAVAAVGWALLQGLFQFYVALAGGGGASVVTGVMLLVTWLYFSGIVMLLGAVVNAVVGGYTDESVDIGSPFAGTAD